MEEGFSPARPIYLQLMDRIARGIVRGETPAGSRLPSVRDAAIASGVNPNTMQRAYMELERTGIVESRRGQGSYVTEDSGRLEQLRQELLEDALVALVATLRDLGMTKDEAVEALRGYVARMDRKPEQEEDPHHG